MSSMLLFWIIVLVVVFGSLAGGWLLAGRPTPTSSARRPPDPWTYQRPSAPDSEPDGQPGPR